MGSPVLEAMMYGPLAADGVLALNTDPHEVFVYLLNYLYQEEVSLPDMIMAMRVYHLAHKYQVDKLSEVCSKYLVDEVQPETVPEVFDTALILEDNLLLQRCTELLLVSPEKVLLSHEVSLLRRSSLRYILTHPRLYISSETIVFRAIITWGWENMSTESNQSPASQDTEEEADKYIQVQDSITQIANQSLSDIVNSESLEALKPSFRKLRQTVEEFLPLVRFLNMTLHELATCVFPSGIISGDECVALVLKVKGINTAVLPSFLTQTQVVKRECTMRETILASLNTTYGSSTRFIFHNEMNVNLLQNFLTSRSISLVGISATCIVSLKEGEVNVWDSTNEIIGKGIWEGTTCSFRRPVRLVPTTSYTVVLTHSDALCSTNIQTPVSLTHKGIVFSGQTSCNGKIVITYYVTDSMHQDTTCEV